MDKKTLIALIAGFGLIVIVVAAFYFTRSKEGFAVPEQIAPDSSYGTDGPLDKKPELNPTEKTNPFTKVKTNPFE